MLRCVTKRTVERPLLLVVDDDRAVLALVGTGLTCLDVLRALHAMNPHYEAVLRTGYENLRAALDALRDNIQSLPSISPVEAERDHIVRTLERVRGNKAVAARLLGVSRRALYRQLERHGLHTRIRMGRRRAAIELSTE